MHLLFAPPTLCDSTLLCDCHLSHGTGISVSLLSLHPDTRLKVLTGLHTSGKLLTGHMTDTQHQPQHPWSLSHLGGHWTPWWWLQRHMLSAYRLSVSASMGSQTPRTKGYWLPRTLNSGICNAQESLRCFY